MRSNQPGKIRKKRGFWQRVFPRTKRLATKELYSFTRHDLDGPLTTLVPESPTDEEIAIELFRRIQYYMGDQEHPSRDDLAEEIALLAIQRREFRDEVYAQILKQLTKNPSRKSEVRGWTLLLFCAQNFAPSEPFQQYVRYFMVQKTSTVGAVPGGVFDETAEIAKQAVKEFDQSVASGEPRQRPSRPDHLKELDDTAAWNVDVMVKLMDESRQKVPITATSTLGDVANEICRRLNMEATGWCVMILNEVDQGIADATTRLLEALSFDLLTQRLLQSTLFALWGFPQFRVLPDSQRVWDIWDPGTEDFPKLMFRRRMISVSEMLYPHPSHAHLTYKQLLWEFRRYPLAESLGILASIVARILISEKWAATISGGALPRRAESMLPDMSRSAIRAMNITYFLLEMNGYIPAVYATQYPEYRREWEVKVQSVYQTLDADEHQLLAINNVLIEMRNLKAFGGLCWLVVEPGDRLFDSLLIGSQMRAAYEGSTVDCTAGALRRLLDRDVRESDFSEVAQGGMQREATTQFGLGSDLLQPMVVTPGDVYHMLDLLTTERQEKERLTDQKKLTPLDKLRKSVKRFVAEHTGVGRLYSRLSGSFEAGERPGSELQLPLWASLNSTGLHFAPAVSIGVTNRLNVTHLTIPNSQIFACETLWTYLHEEELWVPTAVLLCLDMKGADPTSPINSGWSLICCVPLTTSVQSLSAALRAFLPAIQIYGQMPAAAIEVQQSTEPEDGGDEVGTATGQITSMDEEGEYTEEPSAEEATAEFLDAEDQTETAIGDAMDASPTEEEQEESWEAADRDQAANVFQEALEQDDAVDVDDSLPVSSHRNTLKQPVTSNGLRETARGAQKTVRWAQLMVHTAAGPSVRC